MDINNVSSNDICELSPDQLTDLLRILIQLEISTKGINDGNFYVPDKINRRDKGSDGGFTCSDYKESRWLNSKHIVFQNKATNLTPQKCEAELFEEKNPKKLKKQIEKVLDDKGKYILFMGYHPGSEEDLDLRIDAFYNSCRMKRFNFRRKSVGKYNSKKIIPFATNYLSASIKIIQNRGIKRKKNIVSLNELGQLGIDSFYKVCRKKSFNYDRSQFDVYDARKIADWVNNYFPAVIKVMEYRGITRPKGLLTIDELGQYRHIHEFPFISDVFLDEYIKSIQDAISISKTCIRVLGFSGVGKTRLIYEALKRLENSSAKVIYYSIDIADDNIIDFIKSQKNNSSAILVLDNCEDRLYQIVAQEIKSKDSQWSFIGIDYNLQETNDIRSSQNADFLIHLSNVKMQGIVKCILEQKYSQKLSPEKISYIADLADGLPMMAVRFAEAQLDNTLEVSKLLDKDLLKRILFGRDYNNTTKMEDYYNVIRACSLFTHFGFPFDDIIKLFGKEIFLSLKSESELIFTKICNPPINANNFTEACRYFNGKGILERRGKYYIVKPLPLAIQLAVDWWDSNFDKEDVNLLFPKLISLGMSVQFTDRFKYLDKFDSTMRISETVFGPESPFAKAEVLNSELGSRLFRSFVEVNPEIALKALQKAFGEFTKEQLKEVTVGRRNLVWALEKLCFRKETFENAAKILYDFSAAENESWSNNASGIFSQLFHTFLSGTEIDLISRLEVIKYGIEKNDDDYTEIAIRALGSGLITQGFFRMGGAERQGSNLPMEDYKPRRTEIWEYHEKIIGIYTDIIKSKDKFNSQIIEIFSRNMRGLVNWGEWEIVKHGLNTFKVFISNSKKNIIDNLRLILKYEKLTAEIQTEINNFIDEFGPNSILEKFNYLINDASFDHEKQSNGDYIDRGELRAITFAKEILLDKEKLLQLIPFLVKDRLTYGFIFGKTIGEEFEKKDELLTEIITELENTEKEKQNISFLMGLFHTLNDQHRKGVIKSLFNKPNIVSHVPRLAQFYITDFSDIMEIIDLCANNILDVKDLYSLSYGKFQENMSLSELELFCKTIVDINNECKWFLIAFLGQYVYQNREKFISIKNLIIKLISNFNYFINKSKMNTIDDYQFYQLVDGIIKLDGENEFAKTISLQIVQLLNKNKGLVSDPYLKETCTILVEKYYDEFLEIIFPVFCKNDLACWNAQHLLGVHHGNSYTSDPTGVLFNKSDLSKIIRLCENNVPIAPRNIARIMPIYDLEDKSGTEWHPFAKTMIEKFYYIDGFLGDIEIGLHNFGYSGSTVPYYEEQIKLFDKMLCSNIIKVRRWAEKNIEQLKKIIEYEKIRDAEWDINL